MIKYDNIQELPYKRLISREQEIYEKQIIRKTNFLHSELDINKIKNRVTDFIYDKIYNLPQTIFYIKYKNIIILGRKVRSQLSISGKINAINCSQITASMILGVLKNKKQVEKDIIVEYYPMTEDERWNIFNDIKNNKNFEILFPYQERNFKNNKVEKTGKSGWSLNPKKVKYLGYGEQHIREYTKQFLKQYIKNEMIIYDPACSTGQFLYEIKKEYPIIKVIGGDLSKEMIDYARKFLDECECCNAKNSKLPNNSVDIMILRFLNDQVVSKYQAKTIFPNILKKVKINGYIIAFGHTPVLFTKKQFEHFGLNVQQCIAYDSKRCSIFQYYVMRKCCE